MFIERLNGLLKERNLTRSKFLSDLNMGKNQFKYWETKGTPNFSTLLVIADYFDVPVEYLTGAADVSAQKPTSYEIFEQIIHEKGLTAYRVHKDTGLTSVLFTDWKKGKSKPKYDKLKIIADYLGVSVERLQGLEIKDKEILDNHNDMEMKNSFYTEQEQALIEMYRSTTEEGRLRIIQSVMNICDEIEKKSTKPVEDAVG